MFYIFQRYFVNFYWCDIFKCIVKRYWAVIEIELCKEGIIVTVTVTVNATAIAIAIAIAIVIVIAMSDLTEFFFGYLPGSGKLGNDVTKILTSEIKGAFHYVKGLRKFK